MASNRQDAQRMKLANELDTNNAKSMSIATKLDRACIKLLGIENKILQGLKLKSLDELNYKDHGIRTFIYGVIITALNLYGKLLREDKLTDLKKREYRLKLETCINEILSLLEEEIASNPKVQIWQHNYKILMDLHVQVTEVSAAQDSNLKRVQNQLCKHLNESFLIINPTLTSTDIVLVLSKLQGEFWYSLNHQDLAKAKIKLSEYKEMIQKCNLPPINIIDHYDAYYHQKIEYIKDSLSEIEKSARKVKTKDTAVKNTIASTTQDPLLKAYLNSKKGIALGRAHYKDLITHFSCQVNSSLKNLNYREVYFFCNILSEMIQDNLSLFEKELTYEFRQSLEKNLLETNCVLKMLKQFQWLKITDIFKEKHKKYVILQRAKDQDNDDAAFYIAANDIETLADLLNKHRVPYDIKADGSAVIIWFAIDLEYSLFNVYNEYIAIQLSKDAAQSAEGLIPNRKTAEEAKVAEPKAAAGTNKKTAKKLTKKEIKKQAKANTLDLSIRSKGDTILQFDQNHIFNLKDTTNKIYKLYSSFNPNMYVCLDPVLEDFLKNNYSNELKDLFRGLNVGKVLGNSVRRKGFIVGNKKFFPELPNAELYVKYKNRMNSRVSGILTHKVQANKKWFLLFTLQLFTPDHKNRKHVLADTLATKSITQRSK